MFTFEFASTVFIWHGKAAWHFIPLPSDMSQEITKMCAPLRSGWGSIRVRATIGDTTWNTSIFPDKQRDAYLLPIKASVRKAEGLKDGMTASVTLTL